jgi:hypothetical protein
MKMGVLAIGLHIAKKVASALTNIGINADTFISLQSSLKTAKWMQKATPNRNVQRGDAGKHHPATFQETTYQKPDQE